MSKLTALRVAKYALPLAGLVGVAFAISVGLEKLSPQPAEAALPRPAQGIRYASSARIALIIGNSEYPDASAPLRHPVRDAEALADVLQRNGFDVEMQENLGKDEMKRAVERFEDKIRPGVTALIAFGGFGIQIDRQSYMIPVDAQIWKEADVRRDGVSIDAVLSDMHRRGADVKLAILDASRRNPFERRFRGFSGGLAAIDAPAGTLLLSAAGPGKVAYDVDGEHSLLIGELLKEINAPGINAEMVFNHTRVGVSRSSNGEQVPLVSSSLIENFAFVPGSARYAKRVEPDIRITPAERIVEATPDDGATSSRITKAAIDPAREKPIATNASASYELASQPANTAAERPVDKPAEKTIEKTEKPVEKAVEKPAGKEQKARKTETARSRRNLDDVSEEIVREQPRLFLRRNWYGSPFHYNPWRFGGGFPRHSFMRPGGFRF